METIQHPRKISIFRITFIPNTLVQFTHFRFSTTFKFVILKYPASSPHSSNPWSCFPRSACLLVTRTWKPRIRALLSKRGFPAAPATPRRRSLRHGLRPHSRQTASESVLQHSPAATHMQLKFEKHCSRAHMFHSFDLKNPKHTLLAILKFSCILSHLPFVFPSVPEKSFQLCFQASLSLYLRSWLL